MTVSNVEITHHSSLLISSNKQNLQIENIKCWDCIDPGLGLGWSVSGSIQRHNASILFYWDCPLAYTKLCPRNMDQNLDQNHHKLFQNKITWCSSVLYQFFGLYSLLHILWMIIFVHPLYRRSGQGEMRGFCKQQWLHLASHNIHQQHIFFIQPHTISLEANNRWFSAFPLFNF